MLEEGRACFADRDRPGQLRRPAGQQPSFGSARTRPSHGTKKLVGAAYWSLPELESAPIPSHGRGQGFESPPLHIGSSRAGYGWEVDRTSARPAAVIEK